MSGERGFSYSEQHRHECEVRYVVALASRGERAEYLDKVTARRGEAAGERLRTDVATAWQRRKAAPAGSAAE